ncbi:hypothetical protein DFH07DRAFT_778947 [Mycena maculata]|uniref:Uncharacterized protein n=1 Tax=Mycena maculata TaxID=230809 RepID=A0AAD7IAH6_9AGAR|nr:hypothetical protein DFH07DRAFT_778947 [Mycena maculata]
MMKFRQWIFFTASGTMISLPLAPLWPGYRFQGAFGQRLVHPMEPFLGKISKGCQPDEGDVVTLSLSHEGAEHSRTLHILCRLHEESKGRGLLKECFRRPSKSGIASRVHADPNFKHKGEISCVSGLGEDGEAVFSKMDVDVSATCVKLTTENHRRLNDNAVDSETLSILIRNIFLPSSFLSFASTSESLTRMLEELSDPGTHFNNFMWNLWNCYSRGLGCQAMSSQLEPQPHSQQELSWNLNCCVRIISAAKVPVLQVEKLCIDADRCLDTIVTNTLN